MKPQKLKPCFLILNITNGGCCNIELLSKLYTHAMLVIGQLRFNKSNIILYAARSVK